MSKQQGFTLIELVMVIVILGILAATAIPRFIDVSNDARIGVANGVAASLASASTMNFGASLARGQIFGTSLATAAATLGIDNTSGDCTTLPGNTWVNGVVFGVNPGEYTITGAAAPANVGDLVTCTVSLNGAAGVTATFTNIGTM